MGDPRGGETALAFLTALWEVKRRDQRGRDAAEMSMQRARRREGMSLRPSSPRGFVRLCPMEAPAAPIQPGIRGCELRCYTSRLLFGPYPHCMDRSCVCGSARGYDAVLEAQQAADCAVRSV